jgi:hypothetical protein
MRRSTLFRLGLLALTGLALTACGGGGGGSASTTPVVVPSLESQFGVGFNTDFFANPNSQPAVPTAGDIIAVSLTTQPIPLHS